MSESTIFCDDLVIGKSKTGQPSLGLVQQVGGHEDSEESSDSDSSSLLERGFVRVSWYTFPHREEVLQESQLKVVDRSCFPRDVIRTKDGNQLGTVIATNVKCDLVVIGTSKFLNSIDVSKLVPIEAFEQDDLVAYGPWLGRIQETFENLILRFSNGAKAKLDYNTAEEQDLLTEVFPHDSHQNDLIALIYYVGQLLHGSAKAFKDVKWISGEEVKFKPATQYKVLVEQIELHGVKVKWGSKAFPEDDNDEGNSKEGDKMKEVEESSTLVDSDSGTSVDPEPPKREENPAEPPPSIINNKSLKELHRLDHFWQGHVWLGDRFRFQIDEKQAIDLNSQTNKTTKKVRKIRMAKRLEKKLHQSTSQGALDAAKIRKGKSRKVKSATSMQEQSADGDVVSSDSDAAYDADDNEDLCSEEKDDDDCESDPQPSTGSCSSIVEEEEDDVDILVNSESDLNITSPVGQIPTVLGMMSCRVGGFELDFTLVQEKAPHTKKRFQCNIQNPDCSKEVTENISKLFQDFMKSMLKQNKHLLRTTSCAALMTRCPQSVYAFVQQSSLEQQDIFFEYVADGKHTSGIIDKNGKKTEIEYEDDDGGPHPIPQAVQMISEVFNSVLDNGSDDVVLTSTPPGKKQAGPGIKFEPGQWITVEVVKTQSSVEVQWQDGTVQNNVETPTLLPAHHVDDNDFCPGDFVIDKRVPEQSNFYGVVLKVDSQNRMTKIQWIRNGKPAEIEEVSSYEIGDHEELQFRISDIVLRGCNKKSDVEYDLADDQAIGELLRITETGMLQVLWSNGTIGLVHPLDVLNVPNDDENSLLASSDSEDEDGASWTTASSDEEDRIIQDSDSDAIGDGDQPRPNENGVDLSETNHGMGEGAPDLQEMPHENDRRDFEDNIHNEVVEFIQEITNIVCDRMKLKNGDAREEQHENVNEHSEIVGEHSEIVGEQGEEIGEHSEKVSGHSEVVGEHSEIVGEHSKIAGGHSEKVGGHSGIVGEHSEIVGEHSEKVGGHSEKVGGHKDKEEGEGNELVMNDNNAKEAMDMDVGTDVHPLNLGNGQAISNDDVTATISSESMSSSESVVCNSQGFTSFFLESSVPPVHHFITRFFETSKTFVKAVQRDLKLLRTSLSPGIIVKAYEDRMDLLSVLIEGPERTPYEDGIFCFDICLSRNYPDTPPSVHYVSFSPRLNPNLYETGRVCVSLLGTWSGKGSERWTKDSTVLQVLLSLQGLILNSEPYYNEAGYEGHRGTAEGMKNSRCYNEMVILRLVQHMTSVIQNPPKAFEEEMKSFCIKHIPLLLNRVKSLLAQSISAETATDGDSSVVDKPQSTDIGFPLLPLSKGVVLSLKTRLNDLESAMQAAEYL